MSIFQNKKYVPPLASIAAFAWGCAYPLIKLGVEQFMIEADDIGGKTLFAGIRFALAGAVVLLLAKKGKRSFSVKKTDYGWVVAFALLNTALHYFCFYIGVSNSPGSRASILNSLSTFLLVFLACAIFPEEHISKKKLLGCAVGFAGLLLLNMGGDIGGSFTLLGDGRIILNCLCSAFGGILTRIVCKKMDAVVATGLSLGLGGMMLTIAGLLMGGRITTITFAGAWILFFLVCISSVAFYIYNQLIKYHSVGQVAIYNSLIPIFGIMMSCLLLGEAFLTKYIMAGLLVAAGVWILNYSRKN